MILINPAITPLAVRIGTRSAIAVGFGLATAGFAALTFVNARWSYVAFVRPLIGIAAGLGLANGPASSASTESVAADEVGQASGISNMARYVGGSLAVAAAATVFSAVTEHQRAAGLAAADALAIGITRSAPGSFQDRLGWWGELGGKIDDLRRVAVVGERSSGRTCVLSQTASYRSFVAGASCHR
jgi:MFS family permease